MAKGARARPAAPPIAPEGLIKAALIRIFSGEKDADGDKIDPIKQLPVGSHHAHGVATIELDVFLDKSGDIEARAPWPSREVLACALGLAVAELVEESKERGPGSDVDCRLHELLASAAELVIAGEGAEEHGQRALLAMQGVQTAMAEDLPRATRAGATTVKGLAVITDWRPAETSKNARNTA